MISQKATRDGLYGPRTGLKSAFIPHQNMKVLVQLASGLENSANLVVPKD